MSVEILYFAQLREAFGTDSETIEIEPGSTVADIVSMLRERKRWNEGASLPLRFAVNERLVDPSHVLHDGDRVALLTPVSGG